MRKAHAAEREQIASQEQQRSEKVTITTHDGSGCRALRDIPPCSGRYTGMTVAQVKITIVKPPLQLISRLVRNPMQLRKCPAIHATQLVNRWKRCAQSLFPQIELCAVKASGNNKKSGADPYSRCPCPSGSGGLPTESDFYFSKCKTIPSWTPCLRLAMVH